VDQEIDTIQLQQCTNFVLVPSHTYPGIRDIQVTVLAHVSTPEEYQVEAELQDAKLQDLPQKGSVYETTTIEVDKTANAGEQHLHFIFEPIYHDNTYGPASIFTEPGPYTIGFYVTDIMQGGESLQVQTNIVDALNTSEGNQLGLHCQTPPYTLDDLGVSTFPLPTP
jgi:hypothetical protein